MGWELSITGNPKDCVKAVGKAMCGNGATIVEVEQFRAAKVLILHEVKSYPAETTLTIQAAGNRDGRNLSVSVIPSSGNGKVD